MHAGPGSSATGAGFEASVAMAATTATTVKYLRKLEHVTYCVTGGDPQRDDSGNSVIGPPVSTGKDQVVDNAIPHI